MIDLKLPVVLGIDAGLRWCASALYALEPESATDYATIEQLADLRYGNIVVQVPLTNPESAKWDNRRKP
jgi:hypothetical protein